ncbi:MAG: penicillin acylase family protein, partial [Bacteroidota bacterium]
PVEFKLLDYSPEAWTTLKTALFSKAMGESLAGRYSDLKATNTLAKFGPNAFRFLYPEKFPDDLPIIPKEVNYDFEEILTNKEESVTTLRKVTSESLSYQEMVMPDNNLGSNNWAVARGKTADRKPILAGDPHLQLTLPSIWYEIQIHTPSSNAYGVSLPGVPSVIIGFNEHIAWSQTNVGHDVADLYTITWKDSTKQEYLLDSVYIPADKVVEKYTVRNLNLPLSFGQKEVIDTVRYTHWGPVVYESKDLSEKDLALRWIVHDEPTANELTVFSNLNKAQNYEEFAEAIKDYNSPAQNFAFASKTGAIALKVQGKYPLKSEGQGRFVQDGSSTKNAWAGFVPKAHNPTIYNPHWGYISSANQRSTADNYPYYYNRESFEAYRGRILQRNLFKANDITTEDMRALQNNSYSMKAELALPIFLSRVKPETLNDGEKAVLELITKWDYHYRREQLEPLYFDTWFKEFYRMTWDEISEDATADKLLSPTEWRTCFILRDVPETNYFDIKATPKKETAWDIIELSFRSAVQKVLTKIVERPNLNWSNHRNTTIAHLGQIPSFSTKNVYVDGQQNTLNAMRPYAGPSWRMVVELGEKTKASVVYPGGQSGNPGSFYYDNFIDTWAEGAYYEAQFVKTSEEVTGNLVVTQTFLSDRAQEEPVIADTKIGQ